MMNLFKLYFLSLILVFILNNNALFCKQNKYTISGNIVDSTNAQNISGATVRLDRTGFGAIANRNGEFTLSQLPQGNYTLICSMIGYETKKISLANLDSNIHLMILLNPKIFKTEDIIISANRRLQNIQEVTSSSLVLSQNEFINNSQLNFEQVLKKVPGLEVYDENVSIRGSDGFDFGLGTRTLMMIDGIPLLSGDNGDMKFDFVPVTEIERVEVVKGEGSALYGTSAIGGVINLVSSDIKTDWHCFVSTFSGIYTKPRYQEWDYSNSLTTKNTIQAGFSNGSGKFSAILSGNVSKDEGYRSYNDSKDFGLFAKMKYAFSEASDLNMYIIQNATNQADWVYWNSLDSATKPHANTNTSIRLQSNKALVALLYNQILSNNTFLNFKSSLFYTQFYNTYPTNAADYRQSDAFQNFNDMQITTSFGNYTLTSGLSFSNNNVNSLSYGLRNQKIFAMYSQIESKFNSNLITTLGLRYDYEKVLTANSNAEFSPKFGLNYKVNDNLNLRASVGKGFRAPSISERFANISYQGFSVQENLNLKPETSIGGEVGFSYHNEDFFLPFETDVSGFINNFQNLIEATFSSQDYSVIMFQNATSARITGVDLSLNFLLQKNLFLNIATTYIDPIDLTLHQTLKYRSKFSAKTSIDYSYSIFSFDLSYRYSSKVENIDEQIMLQIKDAQSRVPIHVVDCSLSANLAKFVNTNLQVSFNVYNLLDYYYTYMPGNLGPTRLLGLSLNWKI